MIYNLTSYLATQLPTIDFVVNGWVKGSPSDSVMLRQTGGNIEHWYPRKDFAIQILSRAETSVVAKEMIDDVFDLLKNKLQLLLPAKTVNSVVYPAVQTYQTSPVQVPGSIGADEANLEIWSVNFIITTD